MKFTGFGLLSNDVRQLADFYNRVFGAKTEESDVHNLVTIGDFSFPIYNPHLHEDAQDLFRQFQNSSLWLEFAVEDVDAEYSRISALGVNNIVAPHDTPFGRRVIFLQDPEGNVITLYNSNR